MNSSAARWHFCNMILGIVGERISGARQRVNFLGFPNDFVPCRATTLLTFIFGTQPCTQQVLAEILEALPLPTWCTVPSSRLSNTIDTPTTTWFCTSSASMPFVPSFELTTGKTYFLLHASVVVFGLGHFFCARLFEVRAKKNSEACVKALLQSIN
jgi:hypothetical protein